MTKHKNTCVWYKCYIKKDIKKYNNHTKIITDKKLLK